MEIKNYNNENVNILHFQGRSPVMEKFFNKNVSLNKNNILNPVDDLTVLTTFTDKSKSPLVAQLELNNIPYVNSYKEEYGDFVMTNKIMYIINALKEIKTTYVLILDGYDVMVETFDNIIERFKEYNTRMLFNASKNNYPVCCVDRMKCRDYLGQWNHFNAGCAIGYTADFINFYNECNIIMSQDNFTNPWGSEQFILRNIFAQYSEKMLEPTPYIMFDYKCKIFIALSQAYIVPQNPEETIYIAY